MKIDKNLTIGLPIVVALGSLMFAGFTWEGELQYLLYKQEQVIEKNILEINNLKSKVEKSEEIVLALRGDFIFIKTQIDKNKHQLNCLKDSIDIIEIKDRKYQLIDCILQNGKGDKDAN